MKVWEKMLLYPIGLCYWIADSAKKAGNFIGRKTKPAIAMLVAVTMLLSVMPMTVFATTSSVGVTPMTTSDSIKDAKETVFYMKWNTDNAVLSSTSDKNIKTAYVRLYILGHISALSGYQSTWEECKITTSIDETTGAKITYVDLYFKPNILQTTNANAYCYMTTDAQKKAIKKYDEKFDIVRFRVPAGELEEFKNHAEKQGESLTEFMRRSAKDTIKRDNKKAKK